MKNINGNFGFKLSYTEAHLHSVQPRFFFSLVIELKWVSRWVMKRNRKAEKRNIRNEK